MKNKLHTFYPEPRLLWSFTCGKCSKDWDENLNDEIDPSCYDFECPHCGHEADAEPTE